MKGQKTSRLQRGTAGFTLVEMIGVLAIIALLAGMLVPRIMQAIRDARVNSTAVSINTLRAAVAQYMAKHNSLADLSATDCDSDLVSDGVLDKGFEARIGTSADVIQTSGDEAKTGGDISIGDSTTVTGPARYDLDGDGGATYDTEDAAAIVEVVIAGVPVRYARALSLAIDGADLSTDDDHTTDADSFGRVVYGTSASGETDEMDVFVYIAHD